MNVPILPLLDLLISKIFDDQETIIIKLIFSTFVDFIKFLAFSNSAFYEEKFKVYLKSENYF